MKTLFLLLLSGLSFHASAQAFSRPWNLDVHLMPLTYLDPLARHRFGAEVSTVRWGVALDVGTGHGLTARGMGVASSYHFLEIRPQVKYYVPNSTSYPTRMYVGLEGFALQSRATLHDGQYERWEGRHYEGMIAFERADYHRQKWGVQALVGVQYTWARLRVDGYTGVGFRQRQTTFGHVLGPREEAAVNDFDVLGHDRSGRAAGLNLALGVKVGYVVRQRF
ncbi:hypothetical protein SAMN05421823_106256 [Catalinimonas alkaloidigena]|uniref:DUF3575 domain-containing protein n=1 Tax=Catalinimonas alkaloidigena TaxID=1075417 RepID=A0A1G9KUB6_9BACT|nr:hypothetical protein [Catalinimonas alkaloidigena]SDL53206.1 hypothetical protein SAMN05421823_106256 [Catalinimonas alkaloidigena]